MKTYTEIKTEQEAKHTALFNECGLFWAFSNEQFAENKTPLKEGEKYISIGAGGYLPKGNLNTFLEGMKTIKKWFKLEGKSCRTQHIMDELSNYECFYTRDISDAWEVLKDQYTLKQVQEVYNNYINSQ